MLLNHLFKDKEINLTLELFLYMLKEILGNELISVYLYGSVVFDDLSPGYGDFDFLVVVRNDLSDNNAEKIIEMRKTLRNGYFGIYAHMLEGEFLPLHLLKRRVKGKAVYWGTRSERTSNENQLGNFSLVVLKKMGVLIYGTDIKGQIEDISFEDLMDSVKHSIKTIRQYGRNTEGSIHSPEWLFEISRIILWLQEGRLCSKSEAAIWAYQNCRGEWRLFLPKAVEVRKNPSLANEMQIKEWLKNLGQPTQEACDELEGELIARGLKHIGESD